MKVRISYGVELDEVPSMVADMVNQSVAELEQLVADLKSAAGLLPVDNSVMQKGAVAMLDSVRLKLSELDSSLNDSQNIMTGFINAVEAEDQPPVAEAAPAPVPPPAPSAVSVSDLEQAYERAVEERENV